MSPENASLLADLIADEDARRQCGVSAPTWRRYDAMGLLAGAPKVVIRRKSYRVVEQLKRTPLLTGRVAPTRSSAASPRSGPQHVAKPAPGRKGQSTRS